MKNHKIINIIKELHIPQSEIITDGFNTFDYEYILRYLEINNDDLITKYKSLFEDLWEEKLSKTFLFLFHNFNINQDVRILNILYKSRNIIRKLTVYYQGENLYKLLFFHLNKLHK
jgi:hypothetical protein